MLTALVERPTPRAFPPWLDTLAAPMPDIATGWPLLATPVPAGFPAPANDGVARRLSLDTHLIHNPESTFFLRVQGDDLREQGIHHGDLLVVDRTAAASTGSLTVAVINDAFALRYVGRDAQGRRVLQSACPEVPDQLLSGKPDCQIWGVVRWAVHRLWPGRLSS
ncbi:MAG: peptidase S24 [Candidatus Competibacteraceae bacterium]|nr:peptidase S24 [Candidatus Competibacteraceae bacterium]